MISVCVAQSLSRKFGVGLWHRSDNFEKFNGIWSDSFPNPVFLFVIARIKDCMTNLPPIESYKKYELYEVNVGCVCGTRCYYTQHMKGEEWRLEKEKEPPA